jgi:nucleoside-diphosphate-sugar epimerase
MSRILITGGAGFIGFHLARYLLQNTDHTLIIADNFQRGQRDQELESLLESPRVTLHSGDLTLNSTWQALPQDITHIYHLAAMVGVKHCMSQPARVLDTNIKMTQQLVEWAATLTNPQILFASTSEIYAGGYSQNILPVPTPEQIPICVEDLANPRFTYAVSKMVGEQLIRFHAPNTYTFKIVRYHNIYGPRMGFAHVIPEVLRRIQAQESPFSIYGHDQTRAFCYVEDAVKQTVAAMDATVTHDPVFHLGNPQEEITIAELVHKLFALTQYTAPVLLVEAPPGSVNRRCPDISRLAEVFTPSWTPLDKGLAQTYAWYYPYLEQAVYAE